MERNVKSVWHEERESRLWEMEKQLELDYMEPLKVTKLV